LVVLLFAAPDVKINLIHPTLPGRKAKIFAIRKVELLEAELQFSIKPSARFRSELLA